MSYHTSQNLLTVRARHSPRPSSGTSTARVRAICEPEPVRRIGFQVRRLHLDRKVDIIARECLSTRNGLARKLLILEDGEGNADGDGLVWDRARTCGVGISDNRQGNGTSPEKNGGVERIAACNY